MKIMLDKYQSFTYLKNVQQTGLLSSGRDKKMSPLERQIQLKRNGITQTAIAGRLGVPKCTVSLIINEKCVSNRVASAIARAMGVSMALAFPGYPGPKRRKTV